MTRDPQGWIFAARLARRELRGGLIGFRIFIACLALGVAAIAGVGSLTAGLVAGLAADGRAILGGDVELRLTHRPATAAERDWLAARARVGETVHMRAMAYDNAGPARTLVELKAVDGLYPLFGTMVLAPDISLARALEKQNEIYGIVVEPNLLARLNSRIGGRIAIGDAVFEVRATIAREPDRTGDGLMLGPRALIALESLKQTGLVTPGSQIYYHYRLSLPPGTDADRFIAILNAEHPDAGWRVRDWRNGNPGLRQFIDRIGLFLVLVGLTALLVGGVGVANAVRSYLDGKTATIATLKCLGASGALIFRVYLLQVFALAATGVAIGLMVGAAVPAALILLLADIVPVPLKLGIYPAPLALAALYGLLVGLAFALWPLARAREVAPAELFRAVVAPARRLPRTRYIVATVLLFIMLAAVAILASEEKRFALWFVGGSALSFALLTGIARLIALGAKHIGRPRNAALRIALTNLYRPGAATTSVVLSLGLGLALLVAVALIQGNMVRQVQERLPGEAPAFFFVDIQPDQIAEFERLAGAIPGIGEINRVPSLRGRIVKVGSVPAEAVVVATDQRWVLRGDRGLTYSAGVPEGSSIVAGEWWPADYRGPPLVSLEREAAAGLGLGVGDSITVNVLGREIEARIANLRQLAWGSFGLNFVLVYSPGALEGAPHTHIATVKVAAQSEEALHRAVTDRFANISAIRVKEVLVQINGLLDQIGTAVRASAAITLLAGVLVLSGAIISGHRRRVREAVMLKVLGATRNDVLKAYFAEYALVGLITAVVAGAIGWVTAWTIITQVMNAAWVALPGTLVATALISVLATVSLGLAGTGRALSQRPGPILRQA